MKTILIAGDSWGCGEWGRDGISHPGLAAYFMAEDNSATVINLSQPGGDNITSSTRIDNFLETNKNLNISHILVFQTEWLRDCIPSSETFRTTESKKEFIQNIAGGYIALRERTISRFYYYLSNTSTTFNIPIYVVGGCSDTIWIDKLETEYPGVRIICQSQTSLVLENNHKTLDPVYALFTPQSEKIIREIKSHLNNEDLNILLQDIDKGHKRLDLWNNNPTFFWPDGVHPNRKSHEILYQHIKKIVF